MSAEIVWIMGRPASGKTTLASYYTQSLRGNKEVILHLDGDVLRAGLNSDLGFCAKDRLENIRRVCELVRLLSLQGIKTVVSMITPTHNIQDFVRQSLIGLRLHLVYLHCDVHECIRRDPKGLYARALRGEISDFTGVNAPFEEPINPDLILGSDSLAPDLCHKDLMRYLNCGSLKA
ncbi:MAG: adenylyl-sulfate kinase [Candidatus Cloacimonetes bacterium]|nr:adenylyl-sulfate kinase [Candidatus Cloacimonadota bacterium]